MLPRTRVLLWSAPRSISTAFEHSVGSLPGVIGFHEPFSSAFYLGEEKSSPRYAGDESLPGFRYSEVRESLEADYPEAAALFVKDMAYAIEGDLDRLPSGFTHSFLIRDPRRSIPSFYKIMATGKLPQWIEFMPEEVELSALEALYEHFESMYGKRPAVVDADDLLSDPAGIMTAYCAAVGLEFNDSMLQWDASESVKRLAVWEGDWYETLSSSTGFDSGRARIESVFDGLPGKVSTAIDAAMPVYERMRSRRLQAVK